MTPRAIGPVSGAAVVAALLFMPSASQAQSIEPPPTPEQRERPAYNPVGGRIGSFMLYPQIDAMLEYDDNVLADDNGRQGDVIGTLKPVVRVVSLWKRHRLEASAYLSQSLHGRLQSEDTLEAGARIAGFLDVDRDSRLDGNVSIDWLGEDRTRVTATRGTAKPVRYTNMAAHIGYSRQAGDLSLNGQIAVSRLTFQDSVAVDGTPIDEQFRNSTYMSASARVGYRVGPGISVLGRVELDRLDYTQSDPSIASFNRDTSGMKAEIGIHFEFSRLLFGEARIGYLRRWSADPLGSGFRGISFGGAISWYPTSLTSFKLTADRSVEEGGSAMTAGNLRSEVGVTAEYELLRSLTIAGELHVAKIQPLGPLPDTWEYRAELRATCYLNRNLRVIGRFEFFHRNSAPPFSDLSRNRVMLTVRAVF